MTLSSMFKSTLLQVGFLLGFLSMSVPLMAHPLKPASRQVKPVVIENATIHLVSAPPIDPASILFDEGKIVAVGRDLVLPSDVERIDGTNLEVYPGLFCAGGQLGLVEINSVRATRDAQEVGEINSNAKVEVAINPDSELIPVTRANGVLLTLTTPTGGLISGSSAVLQLDGWTWEDMVLRAPAALHVRWPRMIIPPNRVTVEKDTLSPEKIRDQELKNLADFFDEARHYHQSTPDRVDLKLEAMRAVFDRTVPVVVRANTIAQIQAAVAFAAERDVKVVIEGGFDAPFCAPLLLEHDVPVIVSAVYRLPRRRFDPYDSAYTLARRLYEKGVRFCISGVDRFGASNLRNLPYHAATAVAFGLPRDEALKAITLYPAQILGVDDRLGSLDVGHDATLILTDGDPLETTTHVREAFLQGRRLDLSNRHHALWKKYRQKYGRSAD